MNQTPDEHVCKNCGNVFTGFYCNLCGEKVILPQDRSFRTFLNGILIALTLADSKFFKTLWLMIYKPGFISKEFADGRRAKYLKPLSVFFFLNLIYFLTPSIQLFNASLRTQLNSIHGTLIVQTVAGKMQAMGFRDISSFALIYDQKTAGLAKMMVIFFAVLASLPLNLLYRSRNRYFTDHVGLSVELVCFNLFINALILTLLARLSGMGHLLNEIVLSSILVSTNLYFLAFSGKTFYGEKGIKLILKSLTMIVVLKIVMEIYRALLFYVTLWTL